MRITRAARVLLFVLALPAFAWAAGSTLRPVPALAACGDSPGEPQALFYFNPAPVDYQVTGTAPLAVSATFAFDVVVPAGSTASLNWGDGTGSTPFAAQDCGDGDLAWGMVTYSHTYAAPGNYTINWTFSVVGYGATVPVGFVNVQSAAAPTPEPTPTPAPTPAVTPTAVPTATAPATAAAPTAVPPAVVTAAPVQATETATSVPTASGTLAATPTAGATRTPTPTAAVASPTVVAAASTSAPPPPPSTPAAKEPDLPEALADVPTIGDIDTAPATLATNLALAGVTVWVLFSSVLLNQVLQDNRSEIDARTARLTRPLRSLRGRRELGSAPGGQWLGAAVVLAFTGVIYGFLDPHFGLNRASALLFLSAVLGVGLVTYVTAGLEAARTRRVHGVPAAVRPFPASILLAAVSVAASRLLNLQPGVMYGFVASCAIAGPGNIDERRQGSVAIYPVLAGLGLSIFALVAVEPLRSNSDVATSFLGQVFIGAGIVIFIGGIEGVAINMLPLSVTDGGKLYAWHRTVWAAMALVAAFLAWEVLLNRNRSSFDALRPASSLSVLVLFGVYTALTLGLWAYFKFRKEPPPLPEGELRTRP